MSARTLDGPVTGLPTVTLDELQARACLQSRVDRKYVVPDAVVDDLLTDLRDGCEAARVLRIDGREVFAYESVYFDTPDLTCYLGAARRRRRRFKVRTRTYLDSGACFAEVKTRGPRGSTVKTRAPYDRDLRDRLTPEALAFARAVLDAAAVPHPDDPRYAPTLVTRYHRRTFLLPGPHGADSRLTVDTHLTWTAARGSALRLDGLSVVETKTGATPSAADRLLWRRGHRPVRLSKYGTGMAATTPDLPCTPWRRVLDRHVTPALVPAD
ncbi:polyphosphate polymerase domain-containing protein [Cellulomonas wangsupingiae]|uniref:polyphosphate polymerase domain-containing protein n=1 Tax=Cellulomonas wangsupingiae TaxID=2968085 RepID=UPI001D0EC71F|nr:polyphosphate polymerase domain-containing protein [Cellulomonas wangsupingiae]MCM0641082.1 polyphosphate polymerase domain-containing protein [Cellulomonas wangsupingiae]